MLSDAKRFITDNVLDAGEMLLLYGHARVTPNRRGCSYPSVYRGDSNFYHHDDRDFARGSTYSGTISPGMDTNAFYEVCNQAIFYMTSDQVLLANET